MSEASEIVEKCKTNVNNLFSKKDMIWFITIALMSICIYIAFFGKAESYTETVQTGMLFWKGEKEVMRTANNPFTIGPLAALFGCAFYSIICLRCKNEVSIFNENKIETKNIILHFVNLIFTTTLFMLISANINFLGFTFSLRALMIVAIVASFLCIKSLAGYLWIAVVAFMLPQLTKFDHWRVHGYIYIICAYLSLVSQIMILKVFKFDLNAIITDLGFAGNTIKGDINASIETTKNATKKVANIINKNVIRNNDMLVEQINRETKIEIKNDSQ